MLSKNVPEIDSIISKYRQFGVYNDLPDGLILFIILEPVRIKMYVYIRISVVTFMHIYECEVNMHLNKLHS